MICFLCNNSAVSQKQVKSSTYIYVFFKIKDRGIERWLFLFFLLFSRIVFLFVRLSYKIYV